jgi:hypothetical protein
LLTGASNRRKRRGGKMSKNNYTTLNKVLVQAVKQAADGKGRERHSSGERFEEQPICVITRWVGLGFPLGQAVKKCQEAARLSTEKAVQELLGAINYLAAAVIVLQEKEVAKDKTCSTCKNRDEGFCTACAGHNFGSTVEVSPKGTCSNWEERKGG